MKAANLSPASVSSDLKEAVNAYSQAVKQLEATAREQEEEQQEASASGDNFKVPSAVQSHSTCVRYDSPLANQYMCMK